jgi:hypothetical protein
MAGGRKISRENATAALSALLETISVGGSHAHCVTDVYVFGSYARGALTVGDVDVDIEYDARLDPAVERELIDRVVIGRDWNTPQPDPDRNPVAAARAHRCHQDLTGRLTALEQRTWRAGARIEIPGPTF